MPRRVSSFRNLGTLGLALFLACAVCCFGAADADAQARKVSEVEREVNSTISKSKLLVRDGKTEAGLSLLEELNKKYPGDVRVLQVYSQLLRREGRLEEAVPLYRRAMENSPEPGVLFQELEGIHRELRQDVEALELCLEYQERFGERGRWVSREIESLILTGRLGDTAVEKIEKALKSREKNSSLYRLRLSALYFAGRSDDALEAARKLDQDRKAQGAEVMAYAALLESKGELADVLPALDVALEMQPEVGLRLELLNRKAQTLRRLRNIDQALAVYDQIVAESPDGALSRKVLEDKAQILDKELKRKSEALEVYSELLTRVTPVKTAEDAKTANRLQLAMADCHLLLERPEKAGEIYQQMADDATDPGVRVEALFQVGEMLFYQGRSDEAEETYYRIVDEYRTSKWTNNALDRILVIGENGDYDGVPLSALAQSSYYRKLGKLERALALVSEAQDGFPDSEAVDNLLFEEASIYLGLGKPEQAHAVAKDLAERYPESTFAPRGLKIVADYYRKQAGGRALALEIYEDVLVRFPTSIETPEVRGRIDELNGRGPDSSSHFGSETHLRG